MESKFQVIIPMTGNGSRFVAAGYKDLKPLIKVQGKPIIEWIVQKMISQSDDIVFVCRESHLNEISGYEKYLKQLSPGAKILKVKEWEKKGPVFDIMKVSNDIDDNLIM